jgi:hypothetical protein
LEKLSQREKEVSAARRGQAKDSGTSGSDEANPTVPWPRDDRNTTMVINEMTEKDCRDILARSLIGRLGCSHDNQPYVLPICLAYGRDYFYVFSTFGQKIEWMRANPKVCR